MCGLYRDGHIYKHVTVVENFHSVLKVGTEGCQCVGTALINEHFLFLYPAVSFGWSDYNDE